MSLKRKSLANPSANLIEDSKRLAGFWRRGGVIYWVAAYPLNLDGYKSNVTNVLGDILVSDLIDIILMYTPNIMVISWSNNKNTLMDEEYYPSLIQTWLRPLYNQRQSFDSIRIGWVHDTNECHDVPDPKKITHGHVSWCDFLNGVGPVRFNPAWILNWYKDMMGPPASIYDEASNPLPAKEKKWAIENAKLAADQSVGAVGNGTFDFKLVQLEI